MYVLGPYRIPSDFSFARLVGTNVRSTRLFLIAALLSASIGDENASCAPAFFKQGSRVMKQRYPRNAQLDQRLDDAAARLRKEAHGTLPGVQRETFIRRPRKAEPASHTIDLLNSPSLQPK